MAAGVAVLLLIGVATVVGSSREDRAPGATAASPSSGAVAPPPRAPSMAAVADERPRYPVVRRTTVQIAGAATDVYLPLASSARREPRRYPVAVLLADRAVDSAQYGQLAHEIGTHGITVVVPPRARPRAVAEVATWARATARDPEAIGHGLVEPSQLFVVADGAGAGVLAPVRAGVRAAVVHAPANGPNPLAGPRTLLVCPGAESGGGACLDAPAAQPALVIDETTRRAITDEGGTGLRSRGVIDPRRLPAIERVGRWTAWWLLAELGDNEAVTFLERARRDPPPGTRVRIPGG